MATRILHCGDSIENYNICVEQKIAGFTSGGEQPGDLIYLAVKYRKKSLCGARYVLDEITDYKPWPDSERYVMSFNAKNLEFCEPFDLSILSGPGGQHWGPKYLTLAKPINEIKVVELLKYSFNEKKTNKFYKFQEEPNEKIEIDKESDNEQLKALKENPELEVNIMGTFQTINFTFESDPIMGLEKLVSKNFYSLFRQYPEDKSILISENRRFKTQGYKKENFNITGISGIPDAILLNYKKSIKQLQVNLIEYECYGEKKTRVSDKSNYLNAKVIPQLMRFASIFSIITDVNTREKTIKDWIEKIINIINSNPLFEKKMISWVKEINPEIRERGIDREIERLLEASFRTSLKIILIIDELSSEQRSIIKNVINSFKLNIENNIDFEAFVIKLNEKIKLNENDSEYALTVQ